MIHTDGRPTIANCGPIPGLGDAVKGDASTEETSPELADTLATDDPALD